MVEDVNLIVTHDKFFCYYPNLASLNLPIFKYE